MRLRLLLPLIAAVGLLVYSLVVQAAGVSPGTQEDPLVTKSYVDEQLSSATLLNGRVQALENQVARLQQRVQVLEEEVKGLGGQVPATGTIVLIVGKKTATVGGEQRPLDVAPYLFNGRVMLPFRFIGDALGAQVGYAGGEATYSLGTTTIILRVGSRNVKVNDTTETVDIAPQLVEGRFMVPVRVVSETLGARLAWDASSQTVTIEP